VKKRKIILDCDPGHDDAMAILLAGASPEIELLGITTVAGNSYVHNTTRNALILTEMAGIPCSIAQGASRPIIRDQVVAPNIHGESGLEGANLPLPKSRPNELDAIRFIAEKIVTYPHEVTLVPVGPLTNIALLLIQYPHLSTLIPEIVLMGGGIAFGNTTPVAEFNIYADPEAAAIVFKSGIPITVCGLDLTHQAKIYMPEIKKLQCYPSQVVSKMGLLLEFFHQTYFDVFHIEGAPLHDPCTIAYLVAPEMFTAESFYTQVELKGTLTYGQTVVDYWHQSKEKPNAKWLMTIKREQYIALIYDRMKHYA
jgi:purine nucleosidase/pyrimidine-specific ribonucleoside hydrolase